MRVLMLAAFCAALGGAAVLGGCGSVRPEDQAAWVGQPISKLETHPVLLTMQLVRTTASDGTEIRNYVNGQSVASCSGGGSIYKGAIDYGTYQTFSTCVQRFPSCNNIFYVKNGIVTAYIPVGTGGARCYTDDTMRPDFRGAVNM
jgi:hypothetical protein